MIKNKSALRKTIKLRELVKNFEDYSGLPAGEEFLREFRKALKAKNINMEVKDDNTEG